MLGKKRSAPRGKKTLVHKPTSEKLSSLKEKENSNNNKLTQKETNKKITKKRQKKEEEEDESIHSDMESAEESSSSNNNENQDNDLKNTLNTNKIESYDEKKLRMAKMLLDKFDKDNKEEEKSNSEENSENLVNKKIIEKYTKEMKNQTINFFSNKNNEIFVPHETLFIKGHKSTITDLCISSNGEKILSCAKDGRGILFDINSEKKILFPKFSNKSLTCCSFSPDEKSVYFGGKDHYIYQLDLNNYELIQTIKAHSESVTGIAFDKLKDQFYSIGDDKLFKVWSTDVTPSILLNNFYGHTSKINCIKSIPGEMNKYITTSLDGYINLWKVDTESFLQFNVNSMYPIDCITALTNELFFTGNFNGTIQAWKTNKKKSINKIEFSHGYQENFNVNHPFFDLNCKNKGPLVEVGRPILSLESPPFSDLLISGSTDGEINFYKIEENEGVIDIELRNKMNIKNKGCLNVIKYCPEKKYIVVGNGTDNKFGRWNKEYDTKLGITIVKLLE